MIRRGGENIAPVEVETALAAHPDVVECAVAPVPDDDMGKEINAYVVRRDASAVEATELASYLNDRLARFKVPPYWEFRDGLPHTPSERMTKHELEQGRADFRKTTVHLTT
jgi:crotonobetaine/carnitine-CoA ligase